MATTEYAVLGQASPTDTSTTTLYTVASGKRVIVSTLVACNISAATATYDVLISVAGEGAANKQYIAKGVTVHAGMSDFLTAGFTLSATDVVKVVSSAGDAFAFSLFGTVITP